jgi:hypothetical protein
MHAIGITSEPKKKLASVTTANSSKLRNKPNWGRRVKKKKVRDLHFTTGTVQIVASRRP